MISLELQEIRVEFANFILYCVAWGTVVAPEERLLALTEPVVCYYTGDHSSFGGWTEAWTDVYLPWGEVKPYDARAFVAI